jgi:pimeloyl-ACP methyl ester carboxylesterase
VKQAMFGRAVGALLLVLVGLAACTPNRPSTQPPADPNLPVVFVHGFLGSGAQYRSQALRWASNGVDPARVRAFNYNTAVTNASGLDAFVDAVRRDFGVSKVNLVGHSLGTGVVSSYATSHAAKVGRFVLVDGVGCPSGNTSCLVIRAADMGQTHVESSTSAESFDRQYRFFTGKAPATTAIVPESGTIRIGGYALDLQTNVAHAGARGEVWAIDPATGYRTGAAPAGAFTVAADGRWGPVPVTSGASYEIAVNEDGRSGHYYFQPFTRSSNLVHLIGAPATAASETNTNKGPNHSALVVQRQRELWRSHGARNDTLQVGEGANLANVFQNVTGDVIAVHIHDDKATPQSSSLSLLNYFKSQPFQTGVDVYLPATTPPTQTIRVVNDPRGDAGKRQQLAVPNWASSTDRAIVELDDWVG